MKSLQGEKRPNLRVTTISRIADHSHFEDLKERAMLALAWSIGVAAVVALYAVMLVALYHWSSHAPIFPPDLGVGVATEKAPPMR